MAAVYGDRFTGNGSRLALMAAETRPARRTGRAIVSPFLALRVRSVEALDTYGAMLG